MYDQNPFGYANNPATSFLNQSLQQSMNPGSQGALQGQFGNVLNSIQGGVTQSAQNGNFGAASGTVTPQQVAAQMNTGGVMSALPMIGTSMVPKVMFPIAGAWSLYSGVKAMVNFKKGVAQERAENKRFDPKRDLAYNRTLNEMHNLSNKYSYMGPFNIPDQQY